LSLLDKKDIESRKKEFEDIFYLIEKDFDIDNLEKIEDEYNYKKEKQNKLIFKKSLNENKENDNDKNKNKYQKYVSICKNNIFEDYNYLLANKKQFLKESNSFEDDKDEENKDENNQPLDKLLTKKKLDNIENRIKDYLLSYQNENFFKNDIFMKFVEENPLSKSKKNIIINPSIIKCFFEDETVLTSMKKRHTLFDNNLKNQLDKVIQNRNCISNKNEDDFITKQKELARKRSNISDFGNIGCNNNDIIYYSSEDNSSEDDNNENNIKMNDNGNKNRGSFSTGNSTPKLRLSKRGSIFRLSKLNLNLMTVKEEEKENNVNICKSDNESESSESEESEVKNN